MGDYNEINVVLIQTNHFINPLNYQFASEMGVRWVGAFYPRETKVHGKQLEFIF